MDNTSGLRSLGALADSPLSDFVRTAGEEAAQVQNLAHGHNDLGQGRFGAQLLALLLGLSIVLKAGQSLLERDGQRNDGVTGRVLLDPLRDLGKILVLLADVVPLAEVDQVDDGLSREEEQRVDHLDLIASWSAYAVRNANWQQNIMIHLCLHISGRVSSQCDLNVR